MVRKLKGLDTKSAQTPRGRRRVSQFPQPSAWVFGSDQFAAFAIELDVASVGL
jgi:hypothetical protein